MRVDAFDFDLPKDRIALRPVTPRDAARLLRVDSAGALSDHVFTDLAGLLRQGDALVVNDTRVISARLTGIRVREGQSARIEATLHQRVKGDLWRAFLKPAKRVRQGERIRFGSETESGVCLLDHLDAVVEETFANGEASLRFAFYGPVLDEAVERLGNMPLPPYIASRRPTDEADRADYQTMFADEPGAVAAPTAGLHFTPSLMDRLAACGVSLHRLTLHVGAGTFLPVKADDTDNHRMHAENGHISEASAAALNELRAAGGRIVAVGTTVLRLLESAATSGRIEPFAGETSIFITPGYRFRAVDALITNFHLPRSTLFMLVAAFAGLEPIQRAYAHAIAAHYRFYSYGDACLLEKPARGWP
ncbi:MAG: tRNA preQ1(34) S-adenosylmethionine ribosyltransferase-isomerase QueA [Hyphomicrobiales bacterium]|nr:tRNA preQ1(34) S-adenosylmethionine ribosyltransferase-isomerase QueA [Hyphomicrobiales bacterium]